MDTEPNSGRVEWLNRLLESIPKSSARPAAEEIAKLLSRCGFDSGPLLEWLGSFPGESARVTALIGPGLHLHLQWQCKGDGRYENSAYITADEPPPKQSDQNQRS